MIRALFIVLAVVVAVLAWVMSMPWLYLLAGVLALAALGLLVAGWQRARRKAEQPYTSRSYSRENELSALGIMEIREKKPGGSPSADDVERDEDDGWKAPPPRGHAPRSKEHRPRSGRGHERSAARADAASSVDRAEDARSPAAPSSSQPSSAAESSSEDQQRREPSPEDREQAVGGEQASAHRPRRAETRASEKKRRRAEKQRSATEHPGASSSAAASPSEEAGPEEAGPEEAGPEEAGPEEAGLRGVLVPTLQALRAALGAQTTALLVQQEMALEYRIEALVSTHERVRTDGSFSTDAPLLSARAESQPATTATVGEGGVPRAHLGYYLPPMPAIGHVAFAPVQRRSEPSAYFLVADAAADGFADPEPEALMRHFADLLSLLLNRHDRLARAGQTANVEADVDEKPAPQGEEELNADEEASEKEASETAKQAPNAAAQGAPASGAAASGDGQIGAAAAHEARPNSDADDRGPKDDRSAGGRGDGGKARPRREIIAEAMAHAGDGPVALALVYLNRAEHIAGKGPAHVAEAEDALRRRLEEAAPECRIEPFGELTYGLFYTGPTADVEAWATEVERAMAAAGPPLEGGVSIGIAVPQGPGADPEALRQQATEALREAYTTGVCTILE